MSKTESHHQTTGVCHDSFFLGIHASTGLIYNQLFATETSTQPINPQLALELDLVIRCIATSCTTNTKAQRVLKLSCTNNKNISHLNKNI